MLLKKQNQLQPILRLRDNFSSIKQAPKKKISVRKMNLKPRNQSLLILFIPALSIAKTKQVIAIHPQRLLKNKLLKMLNLVILTNPSIFQNHSNQNLKLANPMIPVQIILIILKSLTKNSKQAQSTLLSKIFMPIILIESNMMNPKESSTSIQIEIVHMKHFH